MSGTDEGIYDELTRLNNELVNLQRELAKKNAELARLNDLKNQFLAMAAHDLRKPVGVALTYSEFLLEEANTALTSEHLGFLETIRDSSQLMGRLIDDFLDVAIIESGRLQLDLQPFAVEAIVERAAAIVALPARAKGVDLQVRIAPDLPQAAVDGPKLEQVLINLLGNAVEHSRSGDAVSLSVDAAEQGLVFAVLDQGAGIPQEELADLFAAYRRGSSRKTAHERSLGLGLAIARQIVEAHGGHIEAASKLGAGSTFSFWVPLQTDSP